jgi:hypothetical protein
MVRDRLRKKVFVSRSPLVVRERQIRERFAGHEKDGHGNEHGHEDGNEKRETGQEVKVSRFHSFKVSKLGNFKPLSIPALLARHKPGT